MKTVDPEAFVYLLSQIKDGFVFERFAQDLLCEIVGIEFMPMGGVHDRAIDGLEHTFCQKDNPATIYQISIQADAKSKLKATLNALATNGISCYLRPDFLLNYITLTANRRHANKIFDKMFPTLVGISISHHITTEVCESVHQAVLSHKDLAAARVKAVIASMSTKLMTQEIHKPEALRHYIDEQLKKGDF